MTQPPRVNAVGDLELTDPAAMRALAEPTRLALFDQMRRGPTTAPALAEHLGEPASEIHAHLSELESVGLVSQHGEEWHAVAKGFVFEIPDDPEGQAAGRKLSALMMLAYHDLPGNWVAEAEPHLELDWVRAAGLFNARVDLTPDELRRVQQSLEDALSPYLTRDQDARPAEARPVRVLGYFLPEQ